MNIQHITQTSVDDCRSACAFASREQLIAAHRWCEAQPGGQTARKAVIATALRKQERSAKSLAGKGGRK